MKGWVDLRATIIIIIIIITIIIIISKQYYSNVEWNTDNTTSIAITNKFKIWGACKQWSKNILYNKNILDSYLDPFSINK